LILPNTGPLVVTTHAVAQAKVPDPASILDKYIWRSELGTPTPVPPYEVA